MELSEMLRALEDAGIGVRLETVASSRWRAELTVRMPDGVHPFMRHSVNVYPAGAVRDAVKLIIPHLSPLLPRVKAMQRVLEHS